MQDKKQEAIFVATQNEDDLSRGEQGQGEK